MTQCWHKVPAERPSMAKVSLSMLISNLMSIPVRSLFPLRTSSFLSGCARKLTQDNGQKIIEFGLGTSTDLWEMKENSLKYYYLRQKLIEIGPQLRWL